MKVIVVSDTHMPKKGKKFPNRFISELANADLIIHAGDWQTIEVYEELSRYGKVAGVYGNVDNQDIIVVTEEKKLIELEGFTIGVVHGHGEKKTTEKRALDAFTEEEVDCIIFGHSHIPLLRYFKKTLLFNPGSLTDKRKLPYFSFGILYIEKDIRAEHVFFQ
ncbi:metallophosphoesterase family protein [Thalassobacillus pellis]|uniref:metallophosphoesterase family protein n=1 Tax=Thalassobacillus pellis TaxID=748008 RepID=UPI00195F7C5B|nr:metallophosphoesterase [Thalassobacillus pellis]MBM7553849.1 putative phosphoesterase [Thalassobacillus pellis]